METSDAFLGLQFLDRILATFVHPGSERCGDICLSSGSSSVRAIPFSRLSRTAQYAVNSYIDLSKNVIPVAFCDDHANSS
jgi:hypothetical protein